MPIDGLVHISAIPGDYWELDNGGMGLVGRRTGRRWRMGDSVRVRLSRVDLTQRQVDFELLDADAAASHGTVRAPRRGGAEHRARRGPAGVSRGSSASGRGGGRAADAADAAGVSDTKRHLVYGLHAIGAVIERAPERLLELWIAEPRDDARARSLTDRARAAGVHVQTAGGEALRKLVGDVAHQGAVAAVRPLKPWDEQDLSAALK